jgi:hypothetical protein
VAEARTQPPASRLPTLTEVVMEGDLLAAPVVAAAAAASPVTPAASPVDEASIVDAVMAGLQPRIDLMLEYRLREALAPLLARAADAIVHDARAELAHTLRDVVARAVSQELARRRPR